MICILKFYFIGHDPKKCLEDNGDGFDEDDDCGDRDKPPKQKCADEYIMVMVGQVNPYITKIACSKPKLCLEESSKGKFRESDRLPKINTSGQ